MTAKIGSLNVDVTLETARFKQGAKQVQRELTGLEKSLNGLKKVGAAFAGAFLAVGIGEIANAFRDMAREGLNAASSIAKSAQLAGAGAAEFQKAAFAAKAVGIDSEKLADIYKDVNDKFGDFLATGGGELKDFFDNIAPKVGVTAEQFAKLSGPQALQLYVSSLEKAGVSQQQMTFYMEALANDATALVPLLRNNGAEFNKLAASAERLGIVLSDKEIKEAGEAQKDYLALQEILAAKQAKVAVQNADTFLKYEEAVSNLKLAFFNGVVGLENANQRYNKWALEFNASLRSALNGAASAAASIPARLREMAASAIRAAGEFITVGRNIVLGIVRGIRGAASEMWGALKSTISTGIANAKEQLGIRSPSRVFMEIGDFIGQGLALGIEGRKGDVSTAANGLAESARQAGFEVQAIFDRLFPKAAAARQLADELAKAAAVKDPALREALIKGLKREEAGVATEGFDPIPLSFSPSDSEPLGVMGDGLEKLMEQIAGLGDRAKVTTVAVAQTFKDMAENVLQAVSSLTGAIRGGGFLGILEAVLGLGLQLAGSGLLGSKLAARINTPKVPGNANGTNSAARGLALVGERGPELVRFNGGEQVFSNSRSRAMLGGGGGVTVNINAKDAVLTHQVRQWVAEGMAVAANAGGDIGVSRMNYRQTRRVA